MAEDTDRESTRTRLLAMAVDYENRSKVASELAVAARAVPEGVGAEMAASETDATGAGSDGVVAGGPGADGGEMSEPVRAKPTRLKLDRQASRDSKETIVVSRRPSTRRV